MLFDGSCDFFYVEKMLSLRQHIILDEWWQKCGVKILYRLVFVRQAAASVVR
jgi:hypothetical protein